MPLNRVLAIDCGAAHVALGLFSRSAAGVLRLERHMRAELSAAPADEARWRHELQGTLKDLLRREKWRASGCCLGVPGHLALTKRVKTPSVDREKRPRVAQFEASQNIPHPLEEVSWGWLEMADDGLELELLLGAVKLEALEPLCAAVESAGPAVLRCEPANVALWRAVRRHTDEPVLTVDVGARSTQLVFSGNAGMQPRTLTMGGNTVTAAIAGRLQIGFDEAEQLKRQVNAGRSDATARDAVQAATEEFAERLELEIQRSRLAYLRQPGAVAHGKLWLTGGGVTPGLSSRLSGKLGLPVEALPDDPRLKIDVAASGAESDLAVLTGLADGMLEANSPALDLLPPRRREQLHRRQHLPWWLAVAALLVLLPTPLLVRQHFIRAGQAREAAELQGVLAPLRRLADANADNAERLAQLRQRIALLEELAARRTGWVSFLADLQERFSGAGDVWLDSLEASVVESETETDEPIRRVELVLAGRLLDSGDAGTKVRALFDRLPASSFVASVAHERFDEHSRLGLLRFEVTLQLALEAPL